MIGDEEGPGPRKSWLIGLTLLAVVLFVAGRRFNASEFVALFQRVRPEWLIAAFTLQATTYAAQGEVWRALGAAAGVSVSLPRAYRLSLAKLFIDQTIPSAGVGGTAFAAGALERGGLPRQAGAACIAVNQIAYYLAYAIALGAAAISAALRGRHSGHFVVAAGVFVLVATLVGAAFLRLAGHRALPSATRWGFLRRLLAYLNGADHGLIRSPRLLLRATLMQLLVIGADASTLFVLLRSLDIPASPPRVFGAFMLSTIFRSLTLSPGGLGTFEASCIVTLKHVGVPLPAAFSATLLFRGLSFWLPMIPGLWAWRAESADAHRGSAR